jgi:hypothetical protein
VKNSRKLKAKSRKAKAQSYKAIVYAFGFKLLPLGWYQVTGNFIIKQRA